ncbi:UNVERIFIED_CONTAM: hypothetical protein Sangu_3110100 [Sesamum angustifolium]|uniref:Uncharacterized protein n=1 Tax=Sesamum angustifolium TaxID=2727405 RepID=A0AAW2K7S5_9LAMI
MTHLSKRYLSQGLQCSWKEVFQQILDANELLLEESSEAPQSNAGTSSAPDVSTNNVLILRRSA